MLNDIKFFISNYTTRMESLDGMQYLVAPVVMLKEGVHSGSTGAFYYPDVEIAKSAQLWNGVPVTLPHPEDDSGKAISANSPEMISQFKVGRVFNSHWDKEAESLKAEIWIDVKKMDSLQQGAILDVIKQSKQMDVSTGLFSEEDGESGEWKGEEYNAAVFNFKPDHLALLPNVSGACSWEDGCGVRMNSEIINNFSNKRGLDETMSAVYRAVSAKNTKTSFYYVLEVFKDFVVYEENQVNNNEPVKLYKQNYTIDTDNKVELTDQPIEVRKEVKFINVKANKIQNKEEGKMGEK